MQRHVTHHGPRATVLITALVLALPAGLAAQATGRGEQQDPARRDTRNHKVSPATQQTALRVDVDDLADDPARYYGQRVSVQAPVESVYSRSLFTLDEDKVWSTGRDVLVLNPRPTDAVEGDAEVTVTGVVHIFTRAEIERLHDGWDWDVRPKLIVAFGSRPVLIATSIRGSAGTQFVRAAPPTTEPTTTPTAENEARQSTERSRPDGADNPKASMAAVVPPRSVTAGDLADEPERYYGSRVRVTADVEDVYTSKVFALDEDKVFSTGQDVLVVARGLKRPMTDDMDVTVVGQVKRFSRTDADLDEYGLRPSLVVGFDDRPVIIATSIRTAAGDELLGGASGGGSPGTGDTSRPDVRKRMRASGRRRCHRLERHRVDHAVRPHHRHDTGRGMRCSPQEARPRRGGAVRSARGRHAPHLGRRIQAGSPPGGEPVVLEHRVVVTP